MKKFRKIICLLLAVLLLLPVLSSCAKKPGLYAWYGRVKVDDILRLTIDVGDGEQVYDVPFETYRTLFVFFASRIASTITDDKDVTTIITDEQKTVALKEYTEDELCRYYSLVAIADKLGVGLTDEDMTLYESDYAARVSSYADTLDEAVVKNFKGTREEYAKYLYDQIIEKLDMTPEYLEYSYYKRLLEKRIKAAIEPELASRTALSYCHFKQIYVEFAKGDDEDEKSASEKIGKAYERLKAGEDFDTLMNEYSNSTVYGGEFYFDAGGNIVGSSDGSAVGETTYEAVTALSCGEYSDVLIGDSDDETGYFAIIKRESFDDEFVYGSSSTATAMFMYASVGASSYNEYYLVYTDLLDMYQQNTRIEPTSRRIYNLVRYGFVH